MSLHALPPHTVIIETVASPAGIHGLTHALIRRGRRTLVALPPGLTRAEVHNTLVPDLHPCELALIRQAFGEQATGPVPDETRLWRTVADTTVICREGDAPVPLLVRLPQGQQFTAVS